MSPRLIRLGSADVCRRPALIPMAVLGGAAWIAALHVGHMYPIPVFQSYHATEARIRDVTGQHRDIADLHKHAR